MVEKSLFELLCNYINWIEFLHEEKLKDESTVSNLTKELENAKGTIDKLKARLSIYENTIDSNYGLSNKKFKKDKSEIQKSTYMSSSNATRILQPQQQEQQIYRPDELPQQQMQVVQPQQQEHQIHIQQQVPSYQAQMMPTIVRDVSDAHTQQVHPMVSSPSYIIGPSASQILGYQYQSQPIANGYELMY